MITLVNTSNKTTFTLDSTLKVWFRNDLKVKWPMPEMPVIITGAPLVLPVADGVTRTTPVISHNQVG